MKKNILWLTDADFRGSGYMYLSVPLCDGLQENNDVKMLGLGYKGEPHNFNFSVIPVGNMEEAHMMIRNFLHAPNMWRPDILVVALDVPLHIFFLEKLKEENLKYIAITPLENPPLTMSWTAGLYDADTVFFISEIAKQAAIDSGLMNAEHIRIGTDSDTWRIPSDGEKERVRDALDISDKFVILCVAENQERKNPWALFDIVSKVKQQGVNLKFIWVATENSPVGIKPRDMAIDLGINDELIMVNKGIPSSELLTLYFAADVFLLASKAEGLGLPILEAMSTGVPVVATDTGAITELLSDNRGFLVPPEYTFIDVWGNSKRDMIDREKAAQILVDIYKGVLDAPTATKAAKEYVIGRTWDVPVAQLESKIEEVYHDTQSQ